MAEQMNKEARREEQELIAAHLYDAVGAICEVRTMSNAPYFSGRVLDFDGATLTLTRGDDEPMPVVIYNTECKLTIRVPGDRALLYCAKVCGSSTKLWKVYQFSINSLTEGRAYFRQPVEADGEIVSLTPEKQRSGEEGVRYPCKLKDISLEGARISVPARLERRDEILLTKLYLHPEEAAAFTFRLDVCWADRIGQGEFLYGCRFVAVPDGVQDRLCAAIFAIQRLELKKRRRRE